MSFLNCAGKKKKGSKKEKEPRDRTPAYGSPEEPSEEKASRLIRLNERLKEFEDENQRLKEQQRNEKESKRVLNQELDNLKKQLSEARNKKDTNKITEVAVSSSAIPPGIEEEKARLSENLQSVKKDLENEKKKGEEEIQKLSEDLKKANKALETERNTCEGKVKKIENELKEAKQAVEDERNERIKVEEEKEKFKHDKDAAENKLAHTSKELDIARRESHIPRSPTRAPSDEWKAKIETAEAELKKEREQRLEKERENSRLISDKGILEKEKKAVEDDIEKVKAAKEEELENLRKDLEMNHKNDTRRLEDIIKDMKTSLKDSEAAREKLLTRLSSQTAAQVLDNNPNVSDLSDPNRPQKLGEQLAQVYDDQWTMATEALEKLDKNEEDILKNLLDLLVAIYKHCKDSAENQLARLEEDMFLPPLENASASSPDTNGTELLKSPTSSKHSMSKIPRFTSHKGSRPALPNISTEKKTLDNDNSAGKDKDKPKRALSCTKVKGEKLPEISTEVKKGIKEYRKKVTKQVWPVLEKEIVSKLRKSGEFDDNVIDGCMAYITKCVEICWLMRVQDPPVSLFWSVPEDKSFNTDVYRAYTKSGNQVEYVVWPAMYLYEDGPILMKGVAQGLKQ